jgi:hypothetical protein
MNCKYGNVTCSCNDGFIGTMWSCGVCPATRPNTDERCAANAAFECRYGTDNCICDGNNWYCSVPVCEAPRLDVYPSNCIFPAVHTCEFPAQDQFCTCGGIYSSQLCTCPDAIPVEGSLCLGPVGPGCVYGDRLCDCSGGQWRCGVCPINMPANAAACSISASCSYPTGFCYCDGAAWSCS